MTKIDFPYTCTCGVYSSCSLNLPVTLGSLNIAVPDCVCGNTIAIVPLKHMAENDYFYRVKIYKTERETEERTSKS